MKKWEGVDLDGTLARSIPGNPWNGPIGEPIAPMVERVKEWIAKGKTVRIFTARVSPLAADGSRQSTMALSEVRTRISVWCLHNIGTWLEVTCCKDHNVNRIWDDRARHILRDRGEVGGKENVDEN